MAFQNIKSTQFIFFLLQTCQIMQLKIIADLFQEQVWIKSLPQQLVTRSITFNLQQKDIEYLIDDETNPKLQQFSVNKEIEQAIKTLDGQVYMKCGGRTPKDINSIHKKIKSVRDLVMTVKMSEYLTESLCQQMQGCQLVLRRFRAEFKNQSNEFRAYVVQQKLVGICQKNPSFIAEDITLNQIQRIKQIANIILKQLASNAMRQQVSKQSISQFVFDIFCEQSGKTALIISIQPFHIHALSLFSEPQLRNRAKSEKTKPLIKMVKSESQLKEINLSEYRAGAQLQNQQNLKEWIDLMQKQKEKV